MSSSTPTPTSAQCLASLSWPNHASFVVYFADADGCVSVFSTNTIRLARRDNSKADEEFVFDQVFDEATSQEEIFNCEC